MYATFLLVFLGTLFVVGGLLFPPATYEASVYGHPYHGSAPIGIGVAYLVGFALLAVILRRLRTPWYHAFWVLVPVLGQLTLAIGIIRKFSREPIRAGRVPAGETPR